MKTILAAIDFSKYSDAVIAHAARIARSFEAQLHILHVMTFPRDPLYGSAGSRRPQIDADKAASALEKISRMVPPVPPEWHGVIRHGDPIDEIGRYCGDCQADLVMVASHGFSGWKRILLGSVVEHLARSLTRPLWVMRPVKFIRPNQIDDPKRVLVCCDVNTARQDVIQRAVDISAAFDAELHMAHAAEAPLNETVLDPTSGPYSEVQQALQERLHQCLRGSIPADSVPPDKIKTVVLQGMAGEELLAYARSKGIDLVIVGVRPHRQVEKWLIGSTTESLLRHAACPVITVPTTMS